MTSSHNLGSFTPGPIDDLPSPTRGGRRTQNRTRSAGSARAAEHAVSDGQHVEILRRRGDPEARGGGKALARRPARQMAAPVSGVEGRQHPTPAEYDERHPELFRDRDYLACLGERADPRPDG